MTIPKEFCEGFYSVLYRTGVGGRVLQGENENLLELKVYLRLGCDEAPGVTRAIENPAYKTPATFSEAKPEPTRSSMCTLGQRYARSMTAELQAMTLKAFELLWEQDKDAPEREDE